MAFYVIWHDYDNIAYLTNTTVAACSSDLDNWTFKELTFTGEFPSGYTTNPVDPTVILTEDGVTYRMYFTLGQEGVEGGSKGTFSATSTDLIIWTFEGERYLIDDEDVLDPNLLWVEDHYEFFAGGLPEDQGNHHAISSDGLEFTSLEHFEVTADVEGEAVPVVLSNGMAVNSSYKYYGFLNRAIDAELQPDIRSLTYDGTTEMFVIDDGARLQVDESTGEEEIFIKDPAVSIHPVGSENGYVMIYVTAIP